MALIAAGSTGHHCRYVHFTNFEGHYEISWVVDRKLQGSRLRHSTRYSRETDEKGAAQFCKRWKLPLPPKTVPLEVLMDTWHELLPFADKDRSLIEVVRTMTNTILTCKAWLQITREGGLSQREVEGCVFRAIEDLACELARREKQ